jgi:hypothetical protein
MPAEHTVLLFTDCGNVYRHMRPRACNCVCAGRVTSERCEYAGAAVCADGSVVLCMPGHGEVAVQLPACVREVRAVEIWATSSLERTPTQRGAAIENICGKLPAQDLRAHVERGLARRIDKCFGRRFCIYSVFGNVSFDKGVGWLQYRGVRDMAQFHAFLARQDIAREGMTVHLVILSGNIGQSVTVGAQGLLRQKMTASGRYALHTQIDNDDSTNVNLLMRPRGAAACFRCISVVVTRRGCVMVRVAFARDCELSDAVLAETRQHADGVMQDVMSLC